MGIQNICPKLTRTWVKQTKVIKGFRFSLFYDSSWTTTKDLNLKPCLYLVYLREIKSNFPFWNIWTVVSFRGGGGANDSKKAKVKIGLRPRSPTFFRHFYARTFFWQFFWLKKTYLGQFTQMFFSVHLKIIICI